MLFIMKNSMLRSTIPFSRKHPITMRNNLSRQFITKKLYIMRRQSMSFTQRNVIQRGLKRLTKSRLTMLKRQRLN